MHPMPPMVHDTVMKNIGSLENKGWEFELGGDIVRSKNFRYTSTLRLSHNKTKIKSMGDDGFFLDEVTFPSPGNPGTAVRLQNGLELGQYFIYKYAGLDENGKWMIYDKNNEIVPATDGSTSNLVAENKHFVGNAIPKVILSWDHTFKYKNWDLSIFLRSWLGYDVFSQVNMYYGLANDSQLKRPQVGLHAQPQHQGREDPLRLLARRRLVPQDRRHQTSGIRSICGSGRVISSLRNFT